MARKVQIASYSPISCRFKDLWCVVTEHLHDAAVIRFNIAGETEEREFFWDELNATPETLPVGTNVIGVTGLLRAPSPPSEEDQDAEIQKVRKQVASYLRSQGIDPQTMIGTRPTKEFRKMSAKAWAENLKRQSQSEPNEG